MRSRAWFDIHSWIGLKLSLFMSFILITGTLAVFAHELDWLVTPEMRIAPQESPLNWEAMLANASAHLPEATLEALYAPVDPWFAAQAVALLPTGERRRVHLDPYSGAVTGDTSWSNIHRFLRQTHRHLMLPTRIGVPVVSALSLLLMGSLITGLVIYKKWWRGFFRRPRLNSGARTFWGDLHRLGGLWSLWFIALIAITGLWYLVESLGGQAPPAGIGPPPGQGPLLATSRSLGQSLPVDALVSRAVAAFPGLKVREIRWPRRPGDPLVIVGQGDAWLVRDRANAVALDPRTGQVLDVRDGRDLSGHQRIAEMADPLHFGTFGGIATKLIWFLFGVALSALSISGVYLYGRRIARQVAAGNEPAPSVWRKMGVWAYVGVGLILMSLALTPFRI